MIPAPVATVVEAISTATMPATLQETGTRAFLSIYLQYDDEATPEAAKPDASRLRQKRHE